MVSTERHTIAQEQNANTFLLPYQAQGGTLISVIIGMPGSVIASLATMFLLFTNAANPVFGWIAIATVWTVFAAAMLVAWFVDATDNG